eukprot:jgi/Tetstr1/466062/TSEL_010649.t1
MARGKDERGGGVANSSSKPDSDDDRGPFDYGGSKDLQPAGGHEFQMPGSDGDEEAEEEEHGSLRDDDEDEDEEPETGAFPGAESSPAKTSCPAGESAKTSEVEATRVVQDPNKMVLELPEKCPFQLPPLEKWTGPPIPVATGTSKNRWCKTNWERLVHAVTAIGGVWKMITNSHSPQELTLKVNPWDVIAYLYNHPSFKPCVPNCLVEQSKAEQHPSFKITLADAVRTASPAVLDAMRSASMLKKKWDLVKKEITRWDANYKQSGSYNPDKGDYCLSSASKSKRRDKGMLYVWLLLSAENLADAVARNLTDEVAAEVGMPWATPAGMLGSKNTIL